MDYKLVCLDMDGVIFKDVNFWMELHKTFGTLEQGKELTKKYLHIDYGRLVEEVVVKLWKGKDASPYYDLVNSIEYLPGVEKVIKHIQHTGCKTAIISASSIDVARRVKEDFGIDYLFANELIIRDGVVAGEFKWPIGAGNEAKALIIKNLCVKLSLIPRQVIYVGDSSTDLEAFKIVGRSIAFNSSSDELKKQATYVVDSSDLADIIPYLP